MPCGLSEFSMKILKDRDISLKFILSEFARVYFSDKYDECHILWSMNSKVWLESRLEKGNTVDLPIKQSWVQLSKGALHEIIW